MKSQKVRRDACVCEGEGTRAEGSGKNATDDVVVEVDINARGAADQP